MLRTINIALVVCCLLVTTSSLEAQESRSGALDVNLTVFHSAQHDGLEVGARAMAVDRVPNTVVGRMAELSASVGSDFEGEILAYAVDLLLGVGLATDLFVLYAASGVFTDAFQSIDVRSESVSVDPGVGIPLRLGLWIRPIEPLYIYLMGDARWVFGVEDRQVETFDLFGFGEEFSLRGGVGFDVDELHFRIDYRFLQVAPINYHLVGIGVGPRPEPLEPLSRQ